MSKNSRNVSIDVASTVSNGGCAKALFTRTSRWPYSATAASASATHWASSVMSVGTQSACRSSLRTSSATSSSRSLGPRREHEVRALGREGQADVTTHPRADTRHDRDLALEQHQYSSDSGDRCSSSRSAGHWPESCSLKRPVRLLLGLALVDAGDTVDDVDDRRDQHRLDRRERTVEVPLHEVGEPGEDRCRPRSAAGSRGCTGPRTRRSRAGRRAPSGRRSARRSGGSGRGCPRSIRPSCLHGLHCPQDSTARNPATPCANATRSVVSSKTR